MLGSDKICYTKFRIKTISNFHRRLITSNFRGIIIYQRVKKKHHFQISSDSRRMPSYFIHVTVHGLRLRCHFVPWKIIMKRRDLKRHFWLVPFLLHVFSRSHSNFQCVCSKYSHRLLRECCGCRCCCCCYQTQNSIPNKSYYALYLHIFNCDGCPQFSKSKHDRKCDEKKNKYFYIK